MALGSIVDPSGLEVGMPMGPKVLEKHNIFKHFWYFSQLASKRIYDQHFCQHGPQLNSQNPSEFVPKSSKNRTKIVKIKVQGRSWIIFGAFLGPRWARDRFLVDFGRVWGPIVELFFAQMLICFLICFLACLPKHIPKTIYQKYIPKNMPKNIATKTYQKHIKRTNQKNITKKYKNK